MSHVMQCTTTSGHYRCSKQQGHSGDCETEDHPLQRTFGPFKDAHRSRAYLRGALDVSSGAMLNGIGGIMDVRRAKAEPDVVYRERIWNESRPS